MHILITLLLLSIGLGAKAQVAWTATNNVSSNTYGNMHPRITMDANGNPLVIWGRMTDQSVFFSRWTGSQFTTPVKLNGTLQIATATWMGPDIASHGDTIYVVMKQIPESDTTKHIFLVRSFDGGQTFSTPARVDFIGDSISRFPTITTDATGNPIVAFMKFNASFGDSRWVVTKSSDCGSTFPADTKASGWGGSAGVCDCCPGSIISDGSIDLMLYRNNNANLRDIWAGFSTSNSSAYTNGCNIDNNAWSLTSCPSTGPDGIVNADTLYTVFSSGATGNTLSYISKTTVSTETWMSTQGLTGPIPGLTLQNYPRIAAWGKAVGIVWKQNVSGTAQLPLLFTNNIDGGFAPTWDTVDIADITNADIAIGDGKIAVCWEDDNSGSVKIRIGTYTTITTGNSVSNLEKKFNVYPNPLSTQFTIQTDPAMVDADITIHNINGQVVLGVHNISGNTVVISRDNLPNGIYSLMLKESDKTLPVSKLVVTDGQ